GSTTGSSEVAGDINVVSADGRAHGTIHVKGVIWLDAFCSEGMPGMSSGIGTVSGSGPVYGPDGKALGTLKVSGSATVSGSGMGSGVSGTVTVKGTL
ncbi:MAG: hypothetical protein KGL53_16070, partial [Elusimicrobia bacterium]|nr:hypothetical protein [Elusimicrobiota bacterium]